MVFKVKYARSCVFNSIRYEIREFPKERRTFYGGSQIIYIFIFSEIDYYNYVKLINNVSDKEVLSEIYYTF